MPEGYRHLTFDGRCRIYAAGISGLSNGAIARHPGRDPSTISREFRRDGGGRGYRQGQARRMASARRNGASSVPGKLTEGRRAKVVAKPGRAGPGAGLGASPAGGPRDGRQAADIRPRTRGPQGRRDALQAPPPAEKEAQPAGWPPRGPGSHPGPEGHPGAPGDRRQEGEDR